VSAPALVEKIDEIHFLLLLYILVSSGSEGKV
jgi:hypothetical protein